MRQRPPPLKEIAERIEKGKEKRSRFVQELFKLYDRVRELEGELEEEITELLKRIDEDDFIVEFYGVTLENDGLEWWTKRGKKSMCELMALLRCVIEEENLF